MDHQPSTLQIVCTLMKGCVDLQDHPPGSSIVVTLEHLNGYIHQPRRYPRCMSSRVLHVIPFETNNPKKHRIGGVMEGPISFARKQEREK